MADGIAVQSSPQRNLQPDVTLILKCLMEGENMTNLDNEKVINLV